MFSVPRFFQCFGSSHPNRPIVSMIRFYGMRRSTEHICFTGLKSVLDVKKSMTVKDWRTLREFYDPRVFAGCAVYVIKYSGTCLNDLKVFFQSFEDYEKIPLVLKCLSLPIYVKYKKECTDEDKEEILKIYNDVVNTYPVLSEEMIDSLLIGVSITHAWKKNGLNLLNKLKKIKPVPDVGYSHFISAAFYHNNPSTGWKFINEITSLGGMLHRQVYHSILDYFEQKENPPKVESVMKLIELFEQTSSMPTEDVAMRLCTFFEDNTKTWVARFASVDVRGVCSCCSTKLMKLNPSEKEMEQLAESVLSDVLHESTDYLNSSPDEIARFKDFLSKSKYYNVVLDGLNVAALTKEPRRRFQKLISTILSLKRKGYSVLVIGRKHLMKWSNGKKLPNGVQYFFADNASKDDPFAIYAAVQNGPGTYLVSNDFMGLHFTKLKPAMQSIFRKWQLSSQVLTQFNSALIFPKHSPICQTSADGQMIHVPFSTSPFVFSPDGWLCLQQVSARDKQSGDVLWPKSSINRPDSNLSRTFRGHALKVLDETKENMWWRNRSC